MSDSRKVQEKIEQVAYELYEKRGRTHGDALADWIEAEKIVMQRHAGEIECEAGLVKAAKAKKTTVDTQQKIAKNGTRKTTQRKSEKITEKTRETKSSAAIRKKKE
ncbi:MAG TPA: hypothetical protein DCP92_21935 [Nitrospiraceae bacterium]|jgi:hypothetical protein|nr:hypothetical protein [Nitrospiraceae bacterium]